ncbi:hypothetical protein CLHOM_27880 [Clostridium homopropionicum DSM 5847]|uniref:Lipoprotein n=1 Tax=Clostridium homopropionicum DSM 5847 TaxID=1121318 RepID=A0A0L6Z7B0_9CLOT|nr:hypothetical protein [Clostridium homopropionicum]KOA18849.1 hypothetical protein CLHOM_27880 [Clostridium homopropionicum DSM 5847]SFG90256.1 hypothetical protein SAMN04488501_12236 [Clostridium homopropionicum]
MKLKSKFLLYSWLFLIIVIGSGCGVSQDKKNIYSNNDIIAQEADSFSFGTRSDTGNSKDEVNIKYSGFYGADTIWIIEAEENQEIILKYNSNVKSGDFKLVLINPKKEIENILVGTQQGDKTIKLTKGKYVIKIVGRNAKGEINITRSEI